MLRAELASLLGRSRSESPSPARRPRMQHRVARPRHRAGRRGRDDRFGAPGLFGGLVASGATLRIAAIRERPTAEILPTIQAQITPRTRLIAISHVSWLNGSVLPVRELAAHGVPVLVDGAQGGRRFLSMSRSLAPTTTRVGTEVAPRARRDWGAYVAAGTARKLPRHVPVLLHGASRLRVPQRSRSLRRLLDTSVDRRAPRFAAFAAAAGDDRLGAREGGRALPCAAL